MRNIYNDRIDHARTRMHYNKNSVLSERLNLSKKPSDFMFSEKYGYMENGAISMFNFSNDQDFARMGQNGSSDIVGS